MHPNAALGDSDEVGKSQPRSPMQVGEAASSSGGSGSGADENQPRHANVDHRIDAMRLAAQQAAIREQVANEMESVCRTVSGCSSGNLNKAGSCAVMPARAASPFSGSKGSVVQLTRTASMTLLQNRDSFRSNESFSSSSRSVAVPVHAIAPASNGNTAMQQSESFRSTSSFRSVSAQRPRAGSGGASTPSQGGSATLPYRRSLSNQKLPQGSPQRVSRPASGWTPVSPRGAPGSPRLQESFQSDTSKCVEADSGKPSAPQHLDSRTRLQPSATGNRPGTPNVRSASLTAPARPSGPRLGAGGHLQKRDGPRNQGRPVAVRHGSRPDRGKGYAVVGSFPAAPSSAQARRSPRRGSPRQDDLDDDVMSRRLNNAAEFIDRLVIDSSMLEEARRATDMAREADAISARQSPRKNDGSARRSRSCNVFWRPPPEAERICQSARSPSFVHRAESTDAFSGGAVCRTLSARSERSSAHVLGLGCSALERADSHRSLDGSWGMPGSMSFAPLQPCPMPPAAPLPANSMSSGVASSFGAVVPASVSRSRQNRHMVLSPRGVEQ